MVAEEEFTSQSYLTPAVLKIKLELDKLSDRNCNGHWRWTFQVKPVKSIIICRYAVLTEINQ